MQSQECLNDIVISLHAKAYHFLTQDSETSPDGSIVCVSAQQIFTSQALFCGFNIVRTATESLYGSL